MKTVQRLDPSDPTKITHVRVGNEFQEVSSSDNNILIAEFMGVEPTQISSSLWGLSNTPFWSVTGPTPEKVMQDATSNFKYDSDWNMLMKVVEKIECELGYLVEISESYCRILRATITIEQGGGDFTKISATYQAVVEFINWYNSQTK